MRIDRLLRKLSILLLVGIMISTVNAQNTAINMDHLKGITATFSNHGGLYSGGELIDDGSSNLIPNRSPYQLTFKNTTVKYADGTYVLDVERKYGDYEDIIETRIYHDNGIVSSGRSPGFAIYNNWGFVEADLTQFFDESTNANYTYQFDLTADEFNYNVTVEFMAGSSSVIGYRIASFDRETGITKFLTEVDVETPSGCEQITCTSGFNYTIVLESLEEASTSIAILPWLAGIGIGTLLVASYYTTSYIKKKDYINHQ